MSDSRIVEQIGRVLGDRYRLVAPLGSGASSRVFLADDTKLRRQVAVKVLHDSLAGDDVFLRRFRSEAQLVAQLNHPCVVAVHDWADEEEPFLVTEYLAGGSLRAMLDNHGTITVSQAVKVGLDAARGLDYAHTRGLVHRDIKPDNLLFDEDGRARVADFGLAKALAESSVTEPTGGVLGTARFASPEQARGQSLDEKSDVYSLALALVEAVTGELPFDEDTTIGTLMARVDQPLEVDADVFGKLKGPLERAGRLDPEDRPTANEFGVALMAAAQSLPRPEELPLAGAITYDRNLESGTDATAIAPAPVAGVESRQDAARGPRTRREKRERAAEGKRATETPSPAKRWPWLVAAVAVAAAIVAGIWFTAGDEIRSTPTRAVPDLTSSTWEDLPNVVGDFWAVDRNDTREDNSVPGQIVGQEPEAGTELEEGQEITVFVSLGDRLREVPGQLLGVPVDVAESALLAAGLTLGEVTERNDEDIEAGQVVEILTLERELTTGSPVDLAVSAGPAARVLDESLIGMTFTDAEALLVAQRLTVEQDEAFNNQFAEGVVVALSPEAGEEVPVGSTVTLTVSLGPEPVIIPPTSGVDVLSASTILEDAGLCVGETVGPANTLVVGTDPPTGSEVRWGDCIRIITSQPVEEDPPAEEEDGAADL